MVIGSSNFEIRYLVEGAERPTAPRGVAFFAGLLGLFVHQNVMGKTGAIRRAGFAVGDDLLAFLLHAITSFRGVGGALLYLMIRKSIDTAGLRPRTTPYSFDARQKSKQKNAPRLLARLRRVPGSGLPPCGRKKTHFAQTVFPPFSPGGSPDPAASQGDLTATARQNQNLPGPQL
jgi:hypothetical protein